MTNSNQSIESAYIPTLPGSWSPHFASHEEAAANLDTTGKRLKCFGGPLNGRDNACYPTIIFNVRRACWAVYRVHEQGPALFVGFSSSAKKAKELAESFELPPRLPIIDDKRHIGERLFYRNDLWLDAFQFSIEIQSSDDLNRLFQRALTADDGVATGLGGAIRIVHTNRLRIRHGIERDDEPTNPAA